MFDRPDFPAGRSSSDIDAAGIASCLLVLILLAAWVVALVMIFHGLATKDGWEAARGAGMVFVLLIIRKLLS